MVYVFLLHGLGGHTSSLIPLSLFLQLMGYYNLYRIPYPVDYYDSIERSVDYVDEEISKIIDKNKEDIIIIGQSMGGVIANNLHKKGWNIKKNIYIGSPLHGANLLNQIESILPSNIIKILNKKPYNILKNKPREEEPPHPYHTISMGWFNSHYDGCVYREESMLNEINHIHLPWADHRTIFANPRLWYLVYKLLQVE